MASKIRRCLAVAKGRSSAFPLLVGGLGAASRAAHEALPRCLHESAAVDRGQPSPETHPHLLRPGELLPGISAHEFAQRRENAVAALPDSAALLVPAGTVLRKAGVIPYPFRQSADFYYLTGCSQPGGAALLQKAEGGSVNFTMFMPQNSREVEAWDGHAADAVDAVEFFGASEGRHIHELSQALSGIVKAGRTLFFDSSGPGSASPLRLPVLAEAVAGGRVVSPRSILHRLRWLKSPAEVALMAASAGIIQKAFARAIESSCQLAAAGEPLEEHHVAAVLEGEARKRGAQHMAFPSVVAAGRNAATVHYLRGDQRVNPGEALLVDAGCEYFGYVSDVTRVWAPHGELSEAQREVYEAVLEVLHECTAMCKPGNTLREIHRHSVRRLSQLLVRIGVFPGADPERVAASGAYKLYYPTSVGHWLGMDTHDCDSVGTGQILQPGVVLTMEPGLYLRDSPEVPKPFRGIGVRIEDDIVVTESCPQVLTSAIPKAASALEFVQQKNV